MTIVDVADSDGTNLLKAKQHYFDKHLAGVKRSRSV